MTTTEVPSVTIRRAAMLLRAKGEADWHKPLAKWLDTCAKAYENASVKAAGPALEIATGILKELRR